MIKVLIVDDDKLARQGIISLLNWEKHQMQVVGDVQNGRAALDFVREHEVNLVFVDIDMPEMDGIEFMEKCSQEKPDIRFVVLTFYEEFSYAQSVIRLGGLEYISKASLEFTDGDALLERIEKKYEERSRGTRGIKDETEGEWEKLKKEWDSLYWVFDTIFYEELKERTLTYEPDVRRMERQLIRCVGKMDELLERKDTDIPWFDTVLEELEWIGRMREEWRNAESDRGNEAVSIMKAVKIGEQDFAGRIHVSEVAARVGISRSYFSVRFKKYVGLTFGDFIQNLRIRRAKELLRQTDLSVLDVAEKSGYEDVYYFNRVFREKVCCSPGEYRKKEAGKR